MGGAFARNIELDSGAADIAHPAGAYPGEAEIDLARLAGRKAGDIVGRDLGDQRARLRSHHRDDRPGGRDIGDRREVIADMAGGPNLGVRHLRPARDGEELVLGGPPRPPNRLPTPPRTWGRPERPT